MGKLDGKIAIVTGGGTGIGKGIARAFAEEGCAIVIAARDSKRLHETARELQPVGPAILPIPTDVTSEDSVGELFRETCFQLGEPDILVNNAGRIAGGRIDELSLQQFRDVMDVNVVGAFLCTREVFRIMRKRSGGRIINIGSIASNRARDGSTPYTTSKHALWGLTQCTALDGRPFGIACGQLNPGNTAVERRLQLGGRSASGVDQGPEPMISVSDMANAALYMATLPPSANTLEMTVIPVEQTYIGRG